MKPRQVLMGSAAELEDRPKFSLGVGGIDLTGYGCIKGGRDLVNRTSASADGVQAAVQFNF